MILRLKWKITPIRIFILEVLEEAEEKVIVFQQMVVLEQLVELLLFCFYDDRGDSDDVYILSLFLYVYLFHDVGFVQIKKHR
jgi:hypothetical protein